MKSLYFIGAIPPEPLSAKITKLKLEISDEYNSYRALKSPPHITIIPPFRTENESILVSKLRDFCSRINSFRAFITGFGAFPPRVIYLKVAKNDHLKMLHEQLCVLLEFPTSKKFNPHMTLAFRDLSPEMFGVAWRRYKSSNFDLSFNVSRLFLLKHNLKEWEIIREFPFSKRDLPC